MPLVVHVHWCSLPSSTRHRAAPKLAETLTTSHRGRPRSVPFATDCAPGVLASLRSANALRTPPITRSAHNALRKMVRIRSLLVALWPRGPCPASLRPEHDKYWIVGRTGSRTFRRQPQVTFRRVLPRVLPQTHLSCSQARSRGSSSSAKFSAALARPPTCQRMRAHP